MQPSTLEHLCPNMMMPLGRLTEMGVAHHLTVLVHRGHHLPLE
jgi:hypothetical protein